MHQAKHILAIIVYCFPLISITFSLRFFIYIKSSDPPATKGCCHYIDGNIHTEKRMANVVDAMKLLGLEGRMHLEWVSASEGPKFKETVTWVCRADQGAGPKSTSGCGGIGAKL
ncbi:MAG: F420-non-reducing hydrogenase iron-sulfur subunit D [Candidatus Methanogaster sp.]|nr:MAG: F420-non-reducing hydrogenase iron-sulfur subunit D [ANME-2 cluster archaeon]